MKQMTLNQIESVNGGGPVTVAIGTACSAYGIYSYFVPGPGTLVGLGCAVFGVGVFIGWLVSD